VLFKKPLWGWNVVQSYSACWSTLARNTTCASRPKQLQPLLARTHPWKNSIKTIFIMKVLLPQLDKVLVTASGVKNHNYPKHAPAQFKSTPDFFDQVILYLVKCHGTLFSFSALSLMLRVSKWWKHTKNFDWFIFQSAKTKFAYVGYRKYQTRVFCFFNEPSLCFRSS
jgi:hypothetical protein